MSLPKFTTPLMAGCAVVALTTNSNFAFAQADQADRASDFAIEEIVVTARKRGENLQDVPVTVSAFTAADIDSAGISSMSDYAALIPNVFMVETQASNFAFFNIRGITQMRNLDPSVAVVIDGVLSTTPASMSQELFDIEQIEVLKGPQGALYGRNAMGGAINIRTKRPTNEFEGMARAGYGNGDSLKAQGMISTPLIADKLFARVAASYYNTDGLRDNIAVPGAHGDEAENTSIRARLLWTPSETFEADFRFSFSDDNSAALQFIDVAKIFHERVPGDVSLGQFVGIFGPGHPFFGTAIRGGPEITSAADLTEPRFPNCGNCGNINVAGKVPLQNNLNGIDQRRIYNASLMMNWETSVGTLTSISSYDEVNQFAIGEQPIRTADAVQANTQFRTSEAFSQELRLTSPDEERLRWIVGGYISSSNTFLGSTTQRDKLGVDTLDFLVTRTPFIDSVGICVGNPFFPLDGSNDNQGNCIRGFDGDEGNNLAYALFAQANYDVTETLELSLSIRYDRDERKQTVKTPDFFLDPFLLDPASINEGDVREANFDAFQPKVTLRWTPQDNVTVYATYAQGFRSGGFNRAGIGDLADQRRAGANPPIPLGIADIYPQQDTQGFEGGIKYNTPDGRFIVNVAGFYTTVDDYQTFTAVTIGSLLSQTIIPVTEVKLKGFEIDATAVLHEYLRVNAGFGFTDSEVTADIRRGTIVTAPPTIVGLNAFPTLGNWAPQTPKTTMNLGLQYEQPVALGSEESSVFLRVDYQRIGKLFFVVENISQRDPLNLVNIRGGLNFGPTLRFEGWAKNLTNEDYFAEGFNPAGFFFPGKLREWGFQVTKRF